MHYGLHLDSFKHLCKDGSIRIMPAPEVVRLSLEQHADAVLHPCVRQNETVMLGQVIAKPEAINSAWLHASVSGRVQSIDDRYVVIENDHQDRHSQFCAPIDGWQQWSPPQLIAHLAEGGIAGLGGAAYSTAAKLAARAEHKIESLLINAMECEPFIACDDQLMRERSVRILQGVQILLHASGAQRALMAIESDKPTAIQSLRDALMQMNDRRIEIHVLATAYPGGDEGQLVQQLLGREIPRGKLPSAIGVLINNVATVYACAQWILQGQPLTSRIVTVTGHGIREPANVEVRIGTACRDIINYCGGYQGTIRTLIMGGTMMGKSLRSDDISISKASNCLVAASDADISPAYDELPCIRCGECTHACPVNLLPQQLLMHMRNHNVDAALELGLRDCIECGCCDVVCPSHILLASRFRAAKMQLPK